MGKHKGIAINYLFNRNIENNITLIQILKLKQKRKNKLVSNGNTEGFGCLSTMDPLQFLTIELGPFPQIHKNHNLEIRQITQIKPDN